MLEFPECLSLSLRGHINDAVNWLIKNYGTLFDGIKNVILWVLTNLEGFLLWVPWWLFVAAVFYFSWRETRSYFTPVLLSTMLLIIGMFGLWDLMVNTLALVLTTVFVSVLAGIPLGIVMSRSESFSNLLRPLLDVMQTMPSFVYLIPVLMFFGLGKVPGTIAAIIYASPPVIRLTNLGIRQVPREVVEAGEAFGCTPNQLLFKVQLPLAVPTIMAGINQTTMMALAMVVIASMVGAKGLGEEVLLSIGQLDIGRGFESGLAIVLMAIIIDRLTQNVVKGGRGGSGTQKQTGGDYLKLIKYIKNVFFLKRFP